MPPAPRVQICGKARSRAASSAVRLAREPPEVVTMANRSRSQPMNRLSSSAMSRSATLGSCPAS